MQDFFRGRRLRQTPQMRDFFRETPPVLVEDLIMPYFVVETEDQSLEKEIGTMPGQYDLSLTKLEEHVAKAVDNGLRNIILSVSRVPRMKRPAAPMPKTALFRRPAGP